MRGLLLLVLALIFHPIYLQAQKLSNSFAAVLKNTPGDLKITQYPDGNYLVYGDINYYGSSLSGSLIKVGQSGNLVAGFQKVFTDTEIKKVVVLPSGKIMIQGKFRYLNGTRVGSIALLNADGSVDASFHIGQNTLVDDFEVQSTGKVIIHAYNNSQFTITRLQANGSPDATFSSGLSSFQIFDMLVDANDKIYVAGGNNIYRLASNGAIDNTFSMVADPLIYMGTMALQPDGKILATVTKVILVPSFSLVYTLVRFSTTGAIDNTFLAGDVLSSITSHKSAI